MLLKHLGHCPMIVHRESITREGSCEVAFTAFVNACVVPKMVADSQRYVDCLTAFRINY